MEFKQLKYFVEIVRNGGMTQASEHLFVAQSTISKAVKNLENEFDITLFDRSQRHIKLTDTGEVFYEKAVEFLTLFDKLTMELNDIFEIKKGHIRLGLSPMIKVNLITDNLEKFHKKYSDVTYEVLEGGGKAVENYLSQDEIDIGVTALPVDSSKFNSMPLYKEELFLVLNQSHKLSHKKKVAIHELVDEEFVLLHDDYYLRDMIIENCRKAGFYPKTVAKISQLTFIDNMIKRGLGISIVPKSIADQMGDEVRAIELAGEKIYWHLGLIWKKGSYMNQVTEEWMAFLKQDL
ncbi:MULTISPECIES: cidABC operon transcriptional activator CidR [Mammaliicoccus]|uniref:LysR family transcriptional regulator n=3 Tax=Mammaliicoccus lentus TaxID=42858 RepID=A0AAP1RQE3_MAMLE|nr:MULTISPECIES: LysR family transcriptional regulator [Mammaliicoccus]HBV03051.1 LysR family transcriptional regulator [Staphylococcus sp.]MBF0750488.1 LysR family transcriptional regulator [Mammaliicoccus lentus]MBF0794997.1 LysR family transcriptional regulator [Mammaliicoccus lentus]MBF0840875.1 LysR family transcriptional regulator [Mammaliicoccus lentus]MBU6113605.1 LysR family transcriptional regulator [Mammaliicoccus lentus]